MAVPVSVRYLSLTVVPSTALSNVIAGGVTSEDITVRENVWVFALLYWSVATKRRL
ncbi:MAG: hypothetical protein QW728_07315 [Thermoplasmata archaeon]